MKKFVLIILVFRSCFANSIHDVTTSAFGSVVQGKLAAFGDFNSDKHTDIFTLSDDGKKNVSSILFSGPHLLTSQYVNYLQQFMSILMQNNKCTYNCRVCEFNSNKVIVIWSFVAQHLKHLSDTLMTFCFLLTIYLFFCFLKKGKTLKLFTATSDRTSTEFKFTETVLLTSSSEDVFTNVVPADFNGDTQMDLFVTTQKLPASNTAVNGCVYWGSLSKGSILGKLQLPTSLYRCHTGFNLMKAVY